MSQVETRQIVQEKRFDIRGTARALGCSTSTVWRLVRDGKLGCFRVATRVFIGEAHIRIFLQQNEHPAVINEASRSKAA